MIETLINQIAEKIPMSSGGNLLGFTEDINHALFETSEIIYPYTIQTTGNYQYLVAVKAQIVDSVDRWRDVINAIESIWAAVHYLHFEASSYQYLQKALIFRFVTVPTDEVYFVSGQMTLEGDRYCEFHKRANYNPAPSI